MYIVVKKSHLFFKFHFTNIKLYIKILRNGKKDEISDRSKLMNMLEFSVFMSSKL
jgi:hypothetical protein